MMVMGEGPRVKGGGLEGNEIPRKWGGMKVRGRHP